jgi:hypothetical protein
MRIPVRDVEQKVVGEHSSRSTPNLLNTSLRVRGVRCALETRAQGALSGLAIGSGEAGRIFLAQLTFFHETGVERRVRPKISSHCGLSRVNGGPLAAILSARRWTDSYK